MSDIQHIPDRDALPSVPNPRHVLGVLCKRGHDYQRSGYSVRFRTGGCVACVAAAEKQRRLQKRAQVNEQKRRWNKANAGKRKEISARSYLRHKEKRQAEVRRYRAIHKPEAAARLRQYRMDKPEAFKAYEKTRTRPESYKQLLRDVGRRWKKANPDKRRASYQRRRAMLKDSSLTGDQIAAQRQSQCGACYYCGDPLDNNGNGHVDHKTPLVRGGKNDIANIAIACSGCNLSKGRRTEAEFRSLVFLQ